MLGVLHAFLLTLARPQQGQSDQQAWTRGGKRPPVLPGPLGGEQRSPSSCWTQLRLLFGRRVALGQRSPSLPYSFRAGGPRAGEDSSAASQGETVILLPSSQWSALKAGVPLPSPLPPSPHCLRVPFGARPSHSCSCCARSDTLAELLAAALGRTCAGPPVRLLPTL